MHVVANVIKMITTDTSPIIPIPLDAGNAGKPYSTVQQHP